MAQAHVKAEPPPPAYWSLGASAVLASLSSRPGGLTSAQAAQTLGQDGPNAFENIEGISAWRLALRQFDRWPPRSD